MSSPASDRRARLRSEGICYKCGRAKATRGGRCDACAASENKRHIEQVRRRRIKVIEHYGSKCACPKCPEDNPKFLTVDHVDNDGAAHRKAVGNRGGDPMWRYIINARYPASFQLLCWNCNSGKQTNGGVCPHME